MATRREKAKLLKETSTATNCWGLRDNDPLSTQLRRDALLDIPNPWAAERRKGKTADKK